MSPKGRPTNGEQMLEELIRNMVAKYDNHHSTLKTKIQTDSGANQGMKIEMDRGIESITKPF